VLQKECEKMKALDDEKMKALDDAIEAGGKNSMKCTLILAEGASAKSFVVSISNFNLS
jgi:hypothetical protein